MRECKLFIRRPSLNQSEDLDGQTYANHNYTPSGVEGENWRVGNGFIQFEHIYLLELRQVSKSSWQPVLAVVQPTTYHILDPDPTVGW